MSDPPEDHTPAAQPEPLTKISKKDGKLYSRRAEIELQISVILALPADELLDRANNNDLHSPTYVHSESLIYFARHYHRRHQDPIVSQIAHVLIKRYHGLLLNHYFRSLDADEAASAYSEAISNLFVNVLDLSSDRADYFQVNFASGLQRLAISVYRKYHPKSASRKTSWDELPDEIPSSDISIEDQITEFEEWEEALKDIPDPMRMAFLLRHRDGWPVESKDPNQPTISRRFNITSRTYRNWESRIQLFLEQQRGQPT